MAKVWAYPEDMPLIIQASVNKHPCSHGMRFAHTAGQLVVTKKMTGDLSSWVGWSVDGQHLSSSRLADGTCGKASSTTVQPSGRVGVRCVGVRCSEGTCARGLCGGKGCKPAAAAAGHS